MLKQRVITALIMLPIALVGLFLLQGWAFAVFTGAVVMLAAWEWAHLAGFEQPWLRIFYAVLTGALLFWLYPGHWAGWMVWAALVGWLGAILLIRAYPPLPAVLRWRVVKLLLGIGILVPTWQGLWLLKQHAHGDLWLLTLMLWVWAADIGAYFTGRAWGRHKLAPEVSPGKSREGAMGGLVCAVALTLGVGWSQGAGLGTLLLAALICVPVVLLSIIGDLTESLFKREAGLKDSSQLLPGHGGILDRIDSLTAAVPALAALGVLLP